MAMLQFFPATESLASHCLVPRRFTLAAFHNDRALGCSLTYTKNNSPHPAKHNLLKVVICITSHPLKVIITESTREVLFFTTNWCPQLFMAPTPMRSETPVTKPPSQGVVGSVANPPFRGVASFRVSVLFPKDFCLLIYL